MRRPDGPPEQLPETLGEYRIEGVLGRGGVGVVYRARQQNPDRAVALKVLPPSPSAEAARRFALEQASLARLQHPAIAQIHAAGSFPSASGEQPFLAMELVEGADLRTWLDAARPTKRAGIELWIAICEAVHHAHQKGVVHRDLKPGNILIDGDARPKIVDFGIARMLEAEADEATPQTTLTGQVLGTPAYMSPEQADGRIDCIDTRTDVYALGVIGYLLMSGRLPIDVTGLSISRAIRRVVEDEPVPIGQVAPQHRGDVQNILRRCLQKRPEDRYSSAMALAEDLRRHLANEPVSAREPSTVYVLSRFARRHRALLAATFAVFAALGIALWISLAATADAVAANAATETAKGHAEAAAAAAQRQLAVREAVLAFVSRTFRQADPDRNPEARKLTPGALFAAAGEDIDREFADEPDVAQAVHFELAELLTGVGEAEKAVAHLEKARAVAEPPGQPWLHARIEYSLGIAHGQLGQPQAALESCLAAALRCEQLAAANTPPPEDAPQFPFDVRQALAQARFAVGERGEAERLWRALIADAETSPSTADLQFAASARAGLATICAQDGRVEEAERLVRRAIAALRRDAGYLDEATLSAVNNLAGVQAAAGDFKSALVLQTDVLAAFERLYGPDHPTLLTPTFNLAAIEWRAGDPERALQRLRGLIAKAERDGWGEREQLIGPYANLGQMLWSRGERDEAARSYQRAIDLRLVLSPGADISLSGFYYDLARIRREQGDADQSLRLLRESVRIRIEALGPLHPKVVGRRVDLANAELSEVGGGVDAAQPHLEAVDEVLLPTLGIQHYTTVLSQKLLADCMLLRGDRERAQRYFDVFVERAAQCPSPARWAEAIAALRRRLAE
ncbi:MAG: serine/threonine protein kinase [Planctomycetes bacterium]|nr:serine/threonine protein kinase [Planctomycetota bacterium]